MNYLAEIDTSFLPQNWQYKLLIGGLIFKYLCEFYSAVRGGGGLRRILLAFWFGENLPKVVADDYKQELSKPPFNPPTDNQPKS